MNWPADVRESLTLSRNAGLPFAAAWEIATADHPLEDFMEGCFIRNRDTEGKDFPLWLRNVWEGAYTQRPFKAKEKPTRLEPHLDMPEAVSVSPVASQTPSQANVPKRCKSGDRCGRLGGYGFTRLFCEHHAGELRAISDRHKLAEGFDFDEWNSRTYEAAYG